MPKLPSRDKPQTREKTSSVPSEPLLQLIQWITPLPEKLLSELKSGRSGGSDSSQSVDLLECSEWIDLQNHWKKALHWTDGLDETLSVMLSCIVSTMTKGDQLWVRVIGPPGCGKSTLSEAVSINRDYVFPKDTFTGLSSGFQVDDEGKQNLSMVEKLYGKTLIINDGDSLLQLPNLPQVLSQLRAFYSGNLRTQFKNKMSKDHEGYRTTIILCGTSTLKKLDTSELGERFLDCVVMQSLDNELEMKILESIAGKSLLGEIDEEKKEDDRNHNSSEMTQAIQMTGGYINFLRENMESYVRQVEENLKPEDIALCYQLGQFVSYMRARPSTYQDDYAEKEFGSRLTAQFKKLMVCLAVTLRESSITDEVVQRTMKVAMDTARGSVFDIIDCLNDHPDGIEYSAVAIYTDRNKQSVIKILKFLKKLDAVESFKKKQKGQTSARTEYRLSSLMAELFNSVIRKWRKLK